jgi:hypothetical protein
MNPQREQFLNLKVIPGRLTADEAGWFLGFSAHEIPILIANGLLEPLGRPPTNGPKYFATATLTELHRDAAWLASASDAIVKHWRYQNARKTDATCCPSLTRHNSTTAVR